MKRFLTVYMIVAKRCQPLPTEKTVFVGGSEETSQTLKDLTRSYNFRSFDIELIMLILIVTVIILFWL